jgi:hypothetical protein
MPWSQLQDVIIVDNTCRFISFFLLSVFTNERRVVPCPPSDITVNASLRPTNQWGGRGGVGGGVLGTNVDGNTFIDQTLNSWFSACNYQYNTTGGFRIYIAVDSPMDQS